MAEGRDTILGTDSVYSALLTKLADDLVELFAYATELETARGGNANLNTRLDAIETALGAISTGNVMLVSSNDTTGGYLNGKLLAGEGVDFTEGNDGGNETLTILGENASTTNKGIASFSSSHFTTSSGAVTPIPHTVTAKTGDYSVQAADCLGHITYTNSGAVAAVNFTLPAGAANYMLRFNVVASQYLKVTAAATETFRYIAGQSAAAGYIRSNTVGTCWEIFWNGTEWIVRNLSGTLSVDE